MKIILSIIFYKNSPPKELKFCYSCGKYKINDDFDKNSTICKSCKQKKKIVDISKIVNIVESYFNLEHGSVNKNTRERTIVKARQISMYFAKEMTNISDADIGNNIGNKDRNTVRHAYKTVLSDMKNRNYKRDINYIEKLILKNYDKTNTTAKNNKLHW